MSKKTRAPRTELCAVDSALRELSADDLATVTGGMICTCPRPTTQWTETWPKNDTDLMDFD